MSTRCAACLSEADSDMLTFPRVPLSGVYLDDANGWIPRHDLQLRYCGACGLAHRDRQRLPDHDYRDIDRGTVQQLPNYADDIVTALRRAGVGPQDRILEVGSNDGTFLALLRDSGFRALAGIEPSRVLAQHALDRGFEVTVDYFTRGSAQRVRSAYGAFKAVICRHTLEHVPDPEDLLAAIGRVLDTDGMCVIEVPDFEWVTETLAVHEIWDEHISYFSAANLAILHRRIGFEPTSCASIRFRDTRNLVLTSRWRGTPLAGGGDGGAGVRRTTEGCARLAVWWRRYRDLLAREAGAWPRPVVAIGASHIQSNFVHFAGLAGTVSAFIDDDPRKVGKFVPLDRPVPVMSTAQALAGLGSGTVLRTAFPYPGWMDGIERALAPCGAKFVTPYEGAADLAPSLGDSGHSRPAWK